MLGEMGVVILANQKRVNIEYGNKYGNNICRVGKIKLGFVKQKSNPINRNTTIRVYGVVSCCPLPTFGQL